MIHSGDPVIDWIDIQRYIAQNNLQNVTEHESVVYFSILSPWGVADVDGLQTMIPHDMEKPSWTIEELQTYYKEYKQEIKNNPFKNYI